MEIKGPFEYRSHGNIVLHDYKAIYFFIPKVACSSLKIVMSELLNMKPPNPEKPLAFPHKRHFPFVKKEEIQVRYRDYFKFCFVRNPWDKLVSCYKNKIHADPNYNDKWFKNGVAEIFWRYGDLFRGGMSFEEFVDVVAQIPDKDADNHIKSQHLFFTDHQGNTAADFIGRFESLKEDFLEICKKIGIKESIPMPHLLKSNHAHYKTYYDDNTRQIVSQRYDKDIKLLGYTF